MQTKLFISKQYVILILSYITLMVIYRIILPYADEPDFYFRVHDVIYSNLSIFSPYYYFQDIMSNYQWEEIETESIKHIFLRIIITLVTVVPILLLTLVNRNSDKNKALLISLVFPGMIYYVGILGEEQFTLVLSLMIFLFWDKTIIKLLLLLLISYIDFGNAVVVLGFIAFFTYFRFILSNFSIKIFYFNIFGILIISYIVGINFLTLLLGLPVIGDKAATIFEHYTTIYAYVATKYSLILRPVVTFFTMIFMTPSKIGAYLLYPIYGILLFVSIFKIHNVQNQDLKKYYLLNFLVPIVFVMFMTFILPGYSQAKYYIFLLPFFSLVILNLYSLKKVFNFLIFSNLVVVMHLIIFKII